MPKSVNERRLACYIICALSINGCGCTVLKQPLYSNDTIFIAKFAFC